MLEGKVKGWGGRDLGMGTKVHAMLHMGGMGLSTPGSQEVHKAACLFFSKVSSLGT